MMTLTNLRREPYSFRLFGSQADETYGMVNHGDYFDFTRRHRAARQARDRWRSTSRIPPAARMGDVPNDGVGDRRVSGGLAPRVVDARRHGVLPERREQSDIKDSHDGRIRHHAAGSRAS